MIAVLMMAAALSLPDTPAARHVEALVRAYNDGDEAALIAFAREHYGPAVAGDRAKQEAVAAYWRSVYREFGPVELHSIRTNAPNEIEVWARGTLSRAWVSFDIEAGAAPPHAVAGSGVGRGTHPADIKPEDAPRDLPSFLDDYLRTLAERDLFSGVVLVARDGKPLFERAYGLANREENIPNRLDTRFNLASVSKLFTAVAIARLAQDGKLAFSDPIGKTIPEYPPHIAGKVTIEHLLTHTSGIELDDDASYVDEASKATSVPALLRAQLAHLQKLPHYDSFAPLDHFDYTNEGYDLLGVIIERASGMTYDAYVREHVLRPAGMLDTTPVLLEHLPDRAAIGYTTRNAAGRYLLGSLRNNFLWMGRASTPSGGYFATAGDIGRFANALFGGAIVGSEMLKTMLVPRIARDASSSQGYGFEIATGWASHAGGLPGASARFDYDPDRRITIVVLSNANWVANNVADYIRSVVR